MTIRRTPLIAALLIAGCTAGTITATDAEGEKHITPLFLNAVCIFFCNSSVQTSGSDIDSVGSTGAVSGGSTSQSSSSGGLN